MFLFQFDFKLQTFWYSPINKTLYVSALLLIVVGDYVNKGSNWRG